MPIFIEIRAGEGGDDAKLLVYEQLSVYVKACKRHVLSAEIVDQDVSHATLRVDGPIAKLELFNKESGGHRWQRIPPNDTRPHSSTVTVAVLKEPKTYQLLLRPQDLVVSTCKASGPGGQQMQKTESAVQIKHVPTGMLVRCQSERSQQANRATAMKLLAARILDSESSRFLAKEAADRKKQVGTGMRADKIRTVQVRNGIVTNHINGKKMSLEKYLKGHLEAIL